MWKLEKKVYVPKEHDAIHFYPTEQVFFAFVVFNRQQFTNRSHGNEQLFERQVFIELLQLFSTNLSI